MSSWLENEHAAPAGSGGAGAAAPRKPPEPRRQAVRPLDSWRRRSARRAVNDAHPGGAEIRALLEAAFGRELTGEDIDCAASLTGGGMVQCFDPAQFEAGLALAIAAAVGRGETCHVLSSDESCFAMAGRLSPALAALGIAWEKLESAESGAGRSREGRVVFAPVRTLALAQLRQTDGRPGQSSALREAAHRLFAGDGEVRGSRLRLDFAIVLDADETLCRKSLTAIVGKRRDEDEDGRSHLIQDAFGLAAQLRHGQHFRVGERAVTLTFDGRRHMHGLARCLGGDWERPMETEMLTTGALEAMFLWRKSEDYRVTAERIEVLSDRLRKRCSGGKSWISPIDMIAIKESVQGSGAKARAEGRISIRSLLMRYRKRAGFVKHKARYIDELSSVYGVSRLGGRSTALPDRIVFDIDVLCRRLTACIGTGKCLCIIWEAGGRSSAQLRESLCSQGLALVPAGEARSPLAAGKLEAGVLWVGAEETVAVEAVESLAAAFETVIAVSVDGMEFPPAGARHAMRIALVSSKTGSILRVISALTTLPALRGLLMRALWRKLQRDGNSEEAALRGQLYGFDQSCRRAVDFAQVNNW